MAIDLASADELLSTTRAVRKRLDLTRPVPRALIEQCLNLAVQAPTGSNSQNWRWLVVDDPAKKQALADLYRKAAEGYLPSAGKEAEKRGDQQTQRVMSSAVYLMEKLQDVPVHLIPCVEGRPPADAPPAMWSGFMGSIFPAIWSFQLAARARGLGTVLTTLHLMFEKEAAQILDIPDHVMQVALVPVAYTLGTDFKPAKRPPVANITHWNSW